MTFDEYFGRLEGKRAAVCGLGVSNLPLIRILRGRGIEVEARDRKSELEMGEEADALKALGCELICGPDYLEGIRADVIFRSPGMRQDLPQFTEAVQNGAVLTSEMEAFFEVCPCRTIGITGSEGKTTTSTVVAEILRRAGYRTWLGGNIGTPLLDRVPEMLPEDYAVVELSSFQLMTMWKSADIAIVTNVTPNHLDIHKDMDEYTEAKRNIFAYQSADGRVVLNFDNPVTKGFAAAAKGTVWGFAKDIAAFAETAAAYTEDATAAHAGQSTETDPADIRMSKTTMEAGKAGLHGNAGTVAKTGNAENTAYAGNAGNSRMRRDNDSHQLNRVYLKDGAIFVTANGNTEEIMRYAEIRLVGMHNVENFMAIIGALYGIVPIDAIVDVARTFAGVEHRIEPVRELDGIRYYNNSIASSPTRVIAGLHSFAEKVILIAGGYDKHIPFEPLAEEIPDHVKLLILMGATKGKIRAAVEAYQYECIQKGVDPSAFPRILDVDSMEEAVQTARMNAEKGDVIILSPACASFDMYKNFEERGLHFKRIVNSL